jgi:hypothetical protein
LVDGHDVSPLERFCALLADAGVEFIVVGGQAEVLMGGARVTSDVDLCYRRTAQNLERLAAALGTLRLTLRGAPPDLKFTLDARSLALGQNYAFEVDGEYAVDLWPTWSRSARTKICRVPRPWISADGRFASSASTISSGSSVISVGRKTERHSPSSSDQTASRGGRAPVAGAGRA